jgi:phage recombination protein Bet
MTEKTQERHQDRSRDAAAQSERDRTSKNGQISAEKRGYLAKQYGYTPEQVDVIRNQICLTATDAELEFFLATCRRVKLDPFARQIYFIKRPQRIEDSQGNSSFVDVGRPETSIDGLRASAEQTGAYEGQGVMQWCDDEGEWSDVWLKKGPPRAAKATVFRTGHREPMVNVALFSEFVPKRRNGTIPQMWEKMPANQLAKCAEAGALRRAFPRDLSGLYIDVEMEHTTASAFSAPEPTKQLAPAEKPVLDVAPTETIDADGEIALLLRTVAEAKTRTELAGVGRRITEARNGKLATDARVLAEVKPELEARWKTLPPK